MNDKRRKLKLLPEVLPAPTPSSRATSPRERTMLHMRRLVAATAMLGAGADACSKPPEVVTPPPDLPPPPGTGTGAPTATATQAATAPPEPTAPPTVASSGTPPPPPPPTYAVVDPMPPPAQCNLTTVSAAPKWLKEGALLEVVVASASAQVRLRNPKDSPLSVMGGKVASADFQSGKVRAQVEVDPNATLVVLSVHAQCPGWATLAIKLQIDKAKGRKITTTIDNY